MEKTFRYFTLTWLIAFVVFNAVTFLVPNEVFGVTRFDKPVFWVAYALIVVSYLAQLLTAYLFGKTNKISKMFLNLPVLRAGYLALVVSFVVGIVFMVVPVLPTWLGAVVCVIVAGYFAFSGVTAGATAEVVEKVEEAVKVKTAFIKSLTQDANILVAKATDSVIKANCTRVYEAVRYSDPMSCDKLFDVENQIATTFAQLSDAVAQNNVQAVEQATTLMLALVEERNQKCKLLK